MTLRRAGLNLALLAICLDFTVSGNLLTDCGSAYISDGGALAEKIHPGSYLAILAGVLVAASNRHGHAGLRQIIRRNGLILVFIAGLLICMVYALIFTGTGNLIPLIDTYVPAGMLALVFSQADPRDLARLRLLLQLLLAANACLAVLEAMAQSSLVPIPRGVSSEEDAFRPTALYDHALTGASATMLGWLLRPRLSEAPVMSLAYQAVMIAALLSFGERMPILISLCAVLWLSALNFAPKFLGRTIRPRDVTALLLGPAAIAAIGIAVLASGIGARLTDHLYWDASAGVRLRVYTILGMISTPELIFGTRRDDLLALLEPMRLAYHVGVIENFWLGLLLTLGLIGFPVFVTTFAALLRWLWRQGDRQGRAMIVTLLLVATASNSLGRKSMLLVALTACVLATHPRAAARRLPRAQPVRG
jgi:hypothetical protein